MKILFVNPFYKPYMGGIERIIQRLSQGLNKKDCVEEIGLLTSYNLYPRGTIKDAPRREFTDGMTLFRSDFFPRNVPFITNVRNSGFFSVELRRIISEFNPDIIHFTQDGWYLPNLMVYRLTHNSSKHVYSLFYHDISESMSNRPMILANSYLTNNVDSVHVNSTIERKKVQRVYRTSYGKFQVIPMGVDVPEKVRRKKGKPVTILCVGRLQPSKGQYELVQIYKKILNLTKVGTRLVLVGGDGGDQSKIEQYVKCKRLFKNVEIVGFVSDLEKLKEHYEKADIFVLPARYESFGLVNVEAMSHKTPVVTYAVGAIPEVLRRGAILIKPFNRDEMVKALLGLIEDEDIRKRLGEEAYDYVRKTYSWDNTVTEFYNLYRNILAGD